MLVLIPAFIFLYAIGATLFYRMLKKYPQSSKQRVVAISIFWLPIMLVFFMAES